MPTGLPGADGLRPKAAPLVAVLVAAWTLTLAGSPARAGQVTEADRKRVAKIVPRLKSKEWRTRRDAVLQLSRGGGLAIAALPDLLKLVRDPNQHVAAAAVNASAMVAPKDANVLAKVTAALSDPRPLVRANAANALGAMGDFAASSVPSLSARLNDGNVDVRVNAAEAIGRIGKVDPPSVERLAERLKDNAGADSWKVRLAAAEALGKLGSAAAPAGSKLARCVADPHEKVSAAAVKALGGLGADGVNYLEELLEHSTPKVRQAAVKALVGMRPHSAAALRRALIHKHDDVARTAAYLQGLRGDALEAAKKKARETEDADAGIDTGNGGPKTPEPGTGDPDVAAREKAERECRGWMNMARNFAANNMKEKAKQYLLRITSRHPGTEWAAEAAKLLKEIEAPAKGEKPPEGEEKGEEDEKSDAAS
ncbi:MAG: HEAT repeat domain-containing protein [Planctomycetota bacterium]